MTETLDKSVKTIVDKEEKYLTFSLAGEEYGIEITKIREIIPAAVGITSVPQTPDSIKGVINLRGKVIPVVDLRLRFGMDAVDYTETTCILVVDLAGQAGNILMGVVVDTVSEVLSVKAEDKQLNAANDSKKIHISADMLVSGQEYVYIEFIGNVRATRENTVVTTHRLKIYYKWYCNYDKNCA